MPGAFVTTADAVDREALWLRTPGNANDQLPSLLEDDGGPWEIVQAYWSRTPNNRKRRIYVLRSDMDLMRWANIRTIAGYEFALKAYWPLSSGTGSAEDDQRAFDAAIHLLVMRIRGVGPNTAMGADKTHGGAFLQVAEGSEVTHTTPGVRVHWEDPEQTIRDGVEFQATITYAADDRDMND